MSQDTPEDGRTLRLLSYNIQVGIASRNFHDYLINGWKHLLPSPDRIVNLQRIAELISAYDIVGLQETDAGSLRSHYLNQTEYLADRAGMPYWNTRVNRAMGYLGQHALGLIARQCPERVECVPLPSRIPGRGAMVADFGFAGRSLRVVISHLSLSAKARHQQMEVIARLLEGAPHGVVMADFNCTPTSREIRHLCDMGGLLLPEEPPATYPSWRPKRAIDHVLITGGLSFRQVECLPVGFSDHAPLAVEIAFDD
ncbi:MAG: endonuclease/exonuclease/phosphatase family protein [Halothiobacillaceae bacterium]